MAKKRPVQSELQIPIVRADSRFDNITALWLRMTNPNWPLASPQFHHHAEYRITVKEKMVPLTPRPGDPRIALANYEHLRTRLAELISQAKVKVYPPPATLAAMIGHAMEPAEAGDAPEELEQLRWGAVKLLSPHMSLFFTSLGMANDRTAKPRNDAPTPKDIENVQKVLKGMMTRNPSVETIRKAVKAAGYRMSATKIGKAVKIIKE